MWGVVFTACVVFSFLFLYLTQCLPSLSLTPLRTTHIQQELWTSKKDKAFSMTPTEAINTVYHDESQACVTYLPSLGYFSAVHFLAFAFPAILSGPMNAS
jgi:hypothetical protein